MFKLGYISEQENGGEKGSHTTLFFSPVKVVRGELQKQNKTNGPLPPNKTPNNPILTSSFFCKRHCLLKINCWYYT